MAVKHLFYHRRCTIASRNASGAIRKRWIGARKLRA
jgi:hypothetical protein